jgi:hypothetical protein
MVDDDDPPSLPVPSAAFIIFVAGLSELLLLLLLLDFLDCVPGPVKKQNLLQTLNSAKTDRQRD